MKIFEVKIKTTEEALKGFARTFRALTRGERVEREEGTFFTSVEAARNFFTPERVKLVALIHRHGPTSVYKVAKLCGRDHKNVYEDVKLLEKVGIVKTKLRTGKSRAQRLVATPYDEINLSIPLGAEKTSKQMKDLDLYYDQVGRKMWRKKAGDGQQTPVWEPVAA